jgi:DNA-binding LacI/PurR family transcriptional regulator
MTARSATPVPAHAGRPPTRAWWNGPIARVTSIDVARRAGVSQSTVSLVLSGKGEGRVSPHTATAVREAAAALGYRPNQAARSLKTGAARAVGLVVPDVTNPFFGRVLRGAQRAAARERYAVALVDTDGSYDLGQDAIQGLRGGAVDGFLLFGLVPPAGARDAGEPLVLVESEARGCSSVRLDTEAGIRAAVDHLTALGHERIGHVSAAADEMTFRLRRAAMDASVPLLSRASAPAVTAGHARDAAHPLLARPPAERPTAVVCDDDLMASGVYLAARDLGLAVPADLSVVGFDDLDLAELVHPPLTTVRADGELLGATAFELLAERLAHPARRPKRVVQPVELVVRTSTAPPRG